MQSVINKFTQYLLLNAYSVHSPGLYNGKSGIALCLFEMARHLADESLEDEAFELLQESLVLSNKSKGLDFENGLPGVGFTLLYLIENGFLDADFEELFGEQFNFIQSGIKNPDDFSEKDLPLLYFLELISHVRNTPECAAAIENRLNTAGESLEKQLGEFNTLRSPVVKFDVLNYFESYLKVCLLCKNYMPPVSLLEQYAQLFRQGKIACRFATGYYLEAIALRFPQPGLATIAQSIRENAAKNIYPGILTLSQRIDLLYLLNQDPQQYHKPIALLEKDLFATGDPPYERKIIQAIPRPLLIAGYGSGIARLLLYWVYKENRRIHRDCARFNYLF